MSLLSRAVVRRDIALKLHDKVENSEKDQQPLDVTEDLTKILRDIPVDKIGTLPTKVSDRPSDVWMTIAIVARIASMTQLWNVPIGPIHSYFPPNDKQWLATFRTRWTEVKDSPSKNVIDFVGLLMSGSTLNFV